MLRCINPQHTDTNASMKLLADLNNEQFWCFGCGSTGDIFTANGWLKKAPLTGYEFIKNNVYELAKEYDIEYTEIALTPEQLERLEQLRFNEVVVQLLNAYNEDGSKKNWTDEYGIARGWSTKTLQKLKITTIISYDQFLLDIQKSTGLTASEIQKKGVLDSIFGKNRLTFTLFDEKDRPVGFTARNLDWTKEDKEAKKYYNSHHSALFNKGKTLYGMNFIRNNKGRRLDIFEGNGSFVTAFDKGHKSAVAICGSGLTDDQVNLIVTMGYTHINLVLDNDKTGIAKTKEYMDKLSGLEGLRVEFSRLPFTDKELEEGLKDPDDFIRTKGLSEFFKIKPVGAFEWFMEKEVEAIKTGQPDIVLFVTKMTKIIQNTSNRIERGQQIKKLSELTGIPEVDIRDEMERQVVISTDKVKDSITKKLAKAKSSDEIYALLRDSQDSLENTLASKETRSMLSTEECIASFDDYITILQNKRQGIQGWKTGFSIVDTKISGIPKPIGYDADGLLIPIPGSLVGFAGAPQHGKSTIMQNFLLNIAQLNTDVRVLHWCLDDSRQKTNERLLAMLSGVSWKKITKRIPISPKEQKLVDKAINTLRNLMVEGRLIQKDHSNGSSLPILMKWVEMVQEQSDIPILVVIDSFHKIMSSEGEGNLQDFARTKMFCQKLKSFAQTHNVTIMASLELNKGNKTNKEPELLDMTESRKMEYDFDIISTVYNHFYDMDGVSDQIMMSPEGDKMPLIKLNIRKSKEGGAGPVYFSLNPNTFQIKDYSMDDIARLTNLSEVQDSKVNGITISSPDKGLLGKTLEPWNS